MLEIETVAILGTSRTGTACAVLASLAGCAVRLHAEAEAALASAFESVRHQVEHALAAGALTRTERQRVLDGVLFTAELEEAVTGADLIVDAAAGEPGAQRARLVRLLLLTRASTPVAIAGADVSAEVAAAAAQPGRLLTLRLLDVHGPVPRLVASPGPATAPHALARAEAFALRVNRAARTVGGPAARP